MCAHTHSHTDRHTHTCMHKPSFSPHSHAVSQTAHQIAIVFLGSMLLDKLKLYVSHGKKHCVTSISVWTAHAQKKVQYDFFPPSFQQQQPHCENQVWPRWEGRQKKKREKRPKLRHKSRANWWFKPSPASPVAAGGSPARLEEPYHHSRRRAGPDSSHNQNTSATNPKTQEENQQWGEIIAGDLQTAPAVNAIKYTERAALKHWGKIYRLDANDYSMWL